VRLLKAIQDYWKIFHLIVSKWWEVGAGERLANPVRSGRKQPQRAPFRSLSNLSP